MSTPSSHKFEVTLVADPQAHERVMLFAALVLAGGMAVILHTPIAAPWRALLAAAWLAVQLREMWLFAQASVRLKNLRFRSAGDIAGCDRRGHWFALQLQPGTFVLPGVVWLRLQAENGRQLSTLMLASRTPSDAWRRLQVMLRFAR